MARIESSCKICRREGVSLCGREKCAVKRRPFAPGVHGPAQARMRPRMSSYGLQLREKQKAKRLYGILERQFRKYFEHAIRKKGNTANFLVQMLEMRLDNVVYRLGFAATRRQARQFVGHGFVLVNGKPVNIPSYTVRVGDVISVKDNKREKGIVKQLQDRLAKSAETPRWVSLDAAALSGKVTAVPEGEDLRQVFDPRLIVEFYSR
jgi:small subunit ribosomal protein S4